MAEDRIPVAGEMLAEADAVRLPAGGDDLGERRLAIPQDRLAQIEPVEVEQIEEIEDEVPLPALQPVHQRSEACDARLALYHDLAVEKRRGHRQMCHRFGNGRKTRLPIEALPRQQRDGPILDAQLNAIAVIFDLVNPIGPRRRFGDGRGQARLDEGRERGGLCVGQGCGIDDRLAALGAALLLPGDLATPSRRPDTILLARDLVHVSASDDGARHLLKDIRRGGGSG